MTELDLSFNSIGEQGAAAIAEALKVNSSLTQLGLEQNNIGQDAKKALREAARPGLQLIM